LKKYTDESVLSVSSALPASVEHGEAGFVTCTPLTVLSPCCSWCVQLGEKDIWRNNVKRRWKQTQ